MNNTRNYRRGDIYLSKTGPRIGNRSSTRAVLLLQNDADEFYSTSVFAVPIAMKPSPFPAPSDDVPPVHVSGAVQPRRCGGQAHTDRLRRHAGR